MQEFRMKSFDGYVLHCVLWDDVKEPKGILQITHGMAEYIKRYDRFAKFLNENGYIVFGNDLRAHGESAGAPEKVGLVVGGDLFEETMQDQIFLTKYLVEKYPNLNLFLMGHSYGSFLTQAYIQKCQIPKAVILMGSANQKGALASAGRMIANITAAFKGKDAPAKMIAAMSFGGYQKQFTEGHWITADKTISDAYEKNPYCNKVFSAGFYKYFFKHIGKLYTKDGLDNIPKDYPLFIVSGEKDPVGGPSTLVRKLFDTYKKEGLTNVKMKLYENMRHEILNEINYTEPQKDILEFLNENNK